MALWIMANMVRDKNTLHHLVFFYLGIAGSLAIAYVIPGLGVYVSRLTSEALGRTPYWTLLTAVALGQLLFNQNLSARWRRFIICVLIAVLVYTLYWNRESVSTWGSVFVVAAMLVWFRWRRLRWIAVAVVVILVFVGALSSAIYEFAGGEDEWVESGGSRLVLIQRVIKVTMRNPITGLGPAAYRPYARVKPLLYRGAFWIGPDVSSHNNYVDLFSHVGLLGLGLFIWFAVEIMLLGFHLQASSSQGFAAGYVNGMIAAWVGALTLMLFADWILPFVYNIGFPGFQASVLIWLFLGGLVALENISEFQTV
jgi:O-antigen ligase